MENVPDLDMDYKISSDELGELRCSDLDVPLFTSDVIESILNLFVHDITQEQWKFIADGKIHIKTVLLLSDMCHEIIESISLSVSETVAPQIESWSAQEAARNASSSSITSETSQRTCNYRYVTEEDIQASIGDLLHFCFGKVLGYQQERSHESEMLLEFLSAEVTHRVNNMLAATVQSPSPTKSTESAESESTGSSQTKYMVYFICRILNHLILTDLESPKDEESLKSDSSKGSCPDQVADVAKFTTKSCCSDDVSDMEGLSTAVCYPDDMSDIEEFDTEGCSPDDVSNVEQFTAQACFPNKVTDVEEFCAEGADQICSASEQRRSVLSGDQSLKCSASSADELLQRDRTFLAVLLGKLLDHIAHSTKTSLFDVDFYRTLERLRARTVGEIKSVLPQTVGNIHIPVYKELCRNFGSPKLLHAAMLSGDAAFDEVVVRTLKVQLDSSSEKHISFFTKVKRFFRRSNKVTPACAVITSLSNSEVSNSGKGSTSPLQRKQKRPAMLRMVSSAARILRKPFTSYIGCGSKDK